MQTVISLHIIVILDRFKNSKNLTKTETQYLYKVAASHLSLPPLNSTKNEDEKRYLKRAKELLTTKLSNNKTNKRKSYKTRNTSKKTLMSDVQENLRNEKAKIESNRKLFNIINKFKRLSIRMKSLPEFPVKIFNEGTSLKTQQQFNPSSEPLLNDINNISPSNANESSINYSSKSVLPSSMNMFSLTKTCLRNPNKQITEILKACNSIEKGAKKSERILSNYIQDINNSIEYTQNVSKFASDDK